MTPQALKSSILQQAIKGKLVEQRPEEGTGEELYQQIQSAKQKLIHEGKLKKDKALPAISPEEIPFAVPDTWKWVRIGQVFGLQAGKNITAASIYEEKSEQHPYLCFGGNGVRGYVSSYNCEGHFAIIGRQGALCGNINFAQGQFYATEHAVVVAHYHLSDVVWCGWFLRALNLNQYATATAQPGLSVANIVKVLLPLPPLAEQKRIAAKIEALLSLVDRYAVAYDKLERLNAKFPDEIRKSILQYAVQGKLVPQLSSETPVAPLGTPIDKVPFAIPASWQWVLLQQVATFNPRVIVPELTQEVSFVPMANVSPGYLSQLLTTETCKFLDKKTGYTKFADGDVLLAKITPCFQNLKSVVAQHLHNGIGLGSSEFHVLRAQEKLVIPEYLLLFLKSPFLIEYGKKNFKGTAGQQRIGTAELKACAFPLPPLAEQKRIVARVNELLALVEQLPAS